MSLFKKAIAGAAIALIARSIHRAGARKRAPIDDVKPEIVLDDEYDVTFWMRRLGVSKRRLKAAVKRVGPGVEEVTQLLAAR